MKLKSGKLIVLFLIFHYTMNIDYCFSQWQPDVRLTIDPFPSSTSYNNAWCIASSGNVVHVVWHDGRNGVNNSEIYYKRSTDAGVSWGTDARLTNNTAVSEYPSITVSGSVVHIVWADFRDGNPEIYYKRSTDEGVSWGADARLTNNSNDSFAPSVSVSGQAVHVVWVDTRDVYHEIYYKRSTDGGVSWGADTQLTNNYAVSEYPTITVSGLVIHVVWSDQRDQYKGDGNFEIYYKRSTDEGSSWGVDTRLTNNYLSSRLPSVSISGQVVNVVWVDSRDGNYEIYYKSSTNGGTVWGGDTRLTNNIDISYYPSVTVSDSVVHVVWQDNRDGNYEIYYIRSIDKGYYWSLVTRLTNNTAFSERPSVTVSDSVVHVVWQDNRDGNWEIYYKHGFNENPVGIVNNTEVLDEFNLEQNYPNPFNPSTKIKFEIPLYRGVDVQSTRDGRGVLLVIYDILGREITTLVNEQLQPGTYEVDWDASNYSSGVYYYKLVVGDFIETKKMILIK